MPPGLAAAAVTLFWDVNPPAAMEFDNLRIPPTATTLWPAGSDRAHNPSTKARSTPQYSVNGALRDFLIPSSDTEIKAGASMELLFVIDDGLGNLFPCARLDDPNDPSTARPYQFGYLELKRQRAGVTITVFDLKGGISVGGLLCLPLNCDLGQAAGGTRTPRGYHGTDHQRRIPDYGPRRDFPHRGGDHYQ